MGRIIRYLLPAFANGTFAHRLYTFACRFTA